MHSSRFTSLLAATAVLLSSSPALAQESEFPFPEEPFTDVATSHPSYDAIEYLRQNKILQGYPDGTFKPDRRINRAEFVQLATNPFFLSGQGNNDCVRTHMQGDDITIQYSDVDTSLWYARPVCIASERGLVNGYPDGTFKPVRYTSFVEAAKIIANVFVLDTREEMGEFWYEPYVRGLADEQAIPTSISALNHVMTRGEMAEMFYRLKADVSDKSSLNYDQLKGKHNADSSL